MSEHTKALPWNVSLDGHVIAICDATGEPVLSITFTKDTGVNNDIHRKLSHIVTAVNAHEVLVEALTKLSALGGGRSEGNCIAQEALRKVMP